MSSSLRPLPNMSLPGPSSPNESFLESEKPQIMNNLNEHNSLFSIATIISDYAVQGKAFNSEEWERIFGVKTGHFKLDKRFYEFWFAPDAVDPTQLNCDTHFPPILVPQTISIMDNPVITINYSFKILSQLVQSPKEGPPLKFNPCFRTIAHIESGEPEPPCWIVARKEALFRGLPATEQMDSMNTLNKLKQAGYEILPSALQLATVGLVHHLITGERYLGTPTEQEPHLFHSRCKEIVKSAGDIHRIAVGGQSPTIWSANNYFYGIDYLEDSNHDDAVGVAGLRKFQAIKIQPRKSLTTRNSLKSPPLSSFSDLSSKEVRKTLPQRKYRKLT